MKYCTVYLIALISYTVMSSVAHAEKHISLTPNNQQHSILSLAGSSNNNDFKMYVAESSPSSVLPKGSVKNRYEFAFDLIREASQYRKNMNKAHQEAEIAFKEFIKAHGDDSLASRARYWLGVTYFERGNFLQASEAFLESYKNAPNGGTAIDSLLKLGMSMSYMNKAEEACSVYKKIRKEFSALSSKNEYTLTSETVRLDCK